MPEQYRFRLLGDWQYETRWRLKDGFETNWIIVTRAGRLVIKRAYSWDGCSGPVGQGENCVVPVTWPLIFDIKNPSAVYFHPCTARGSLVHDACYQYLETFEALGVSRLMIDKLFYRLILNDGFPRGHAALYYAGVRIAGGIYHRLGPYYNA